MVDGFQYTVAAGPVGWAINSNDGTPAPPGQQWWEMQVTVHNVQTDREAPIGPAYSTVAEAHGPKVPCPGGQIECTMALQPWPAQPAPGDGPAYFAPGQTISLLYESTGPVPAPLKSSDFTWRFITDLGALGLNPSGPNLDIPPLT